MSQSQEPLILCLETSGQICSVAIFKGGILLQTLQADDVWSHSAQLTLLIKECLDAQNLETTDLNAIAISHGPGSYTGLRVGASTAKGMCYALDIPLISIPTLHTIAFPHLSKVEDSQVIIPLIDARRMEVYYSILNNQLKSIKEVDNHILQAESFKEYDSKGGIVCGDGAEKASEILELENFEIITNMPHAQSMGMLALNRLDNQLTEDTAYYNPFYFKPPNITKSKKKLL